MIRRDPHADRPDRAFGDGLAQQRPRIAVELPAPVQRLLLALIREDADIGHRGVGAPLLSQKLDEPTVDVDQTLERGARSWRSARTVFFLYAAPGRNTLRVRRSPVVSVVAIGSARMRRPVAANTALPMAPAMGTTPGSPAPPGG